MIHTALPLIFDRRWKPTLAEHSPTSSLPSQIGRRRGNFLGLSVMFLLQLAVHKTPTRFATCGEARDAVWMTTVSGFRCWAPDADRFDAPATKTRRRGGVHPCASHLTRSPRFSSLLQRPKAEPADSPQHVYRMVIDIGATPQFLTLGHGDPGVFDNSGHFSSQLLVSSV